MKLLVPAVLTLCSGCLVLAAADPVSGKWQVHQSIANNESDMTCTFTQSGDAVAGECSGSNGIMKLTGQVAEKKVSWTMKSEYNGTPLTLSYVGTVASATKITGSVSVDPYQVTGEFTASLAK